MDRKLNIEVVIDLHSIDRALDEKEREQFRYFVKENVRSRFHKPFFKKEVRVNIQANRSLYTINGACNRELSEYVNELFDQFCSK